MHGFEQDGSALLWRAENETVRIEPWGADSVRVRATKNRELTDRDWALLPPAHAKSTVNIGEDESTLTVGGLCVKVSAAGRIQFCKTGSGDMLLEDTPVQMLHPRLREYRAVDGDLWRIEACFVAQDGEKLFGLGQHRHGKLDQKGCVLDLVQRNCEVSIPFLVSNRGYGFLWNNPALGRVELGGTRTRWVADAAREVDYWVTAGDTPASILAHYADATGHPRMLPDWASGFWQSKLRYLTQDELMTVAREHKKRGLPLSVIVCDFFHWTRQGDWKFDLDAWPDPAGMVKELAAMGVKLLVSVWPSVNVNSENFETLRERGLLLRTDRGVAAIFPFTDVGTDGTVHIYYYDPTSDEARAFLWDKMKKNYLAHGIDLFWLDACEPEMVPVDHANLRYAIGSGAEVGCIYPWYHEKGYCEGLESEGVKEIVTLCRSAWAGSQRFGAAVWSGDIESSFEVLTGQVRAGLNMALSGIPWWTTDIGGFHSGDPTTPYFRELIVRWFQYGAFCPLFRLHGHRQPATRKSGADNEVWTFGDEAYKIIVPYMELRERLRPYVMEQMKVAHETGVPPMRPVWFDFPEDEDAWTVEDAFLLGPDLLVAPVTSEGARSREVYLPAGATWTDAWTGETHEGGQCITSAAPLERIPLYLRDGAALPIREA